MEANPQLISINTTVGKYKLFEVMCMCAALQVYELPLAVRVVKIQNSYTLNNSVSQCETITFIIAFIVTLKQSQNGTVEIH